MKIDESLRAAYMRQRALAERIKAKVDQELSNSKRASWHYESRVKAEESFALKVECGRPDDPNAIEDAFGCVLVVPNFSDVRVAEQLIVDLYGAPVRKRPESLEMTKKSPTDFRFDDLRLYVQYRDQGYGPPSGLAGTLFEVQIRTFLQHAWTIATHDVVYKAEDVSWRRERIAAQAKAALEQAEVTIESMAALETSPVLPVTSRQFDLINLTIAILREHWGAEQLPADVRRLAVGVHDLLKRLSLENEGAFRSLLVNGRERYGGNHNLDWSPYRAILQYVAEQHGPALKRILRRNSGDATFVYPDILAELQLPADEAVRAVVIDKNN